MDPEALMKLAVKAALDGIEKGQSPFGCAIARENELLVCRHNSVLAALDITAHAEITALRAACLEIDAIHLPGAVVASTCEPCAMCMAALHWARVDVVYYGATIEDARTAGFNELQLPAAELLRLGQSKVQLVPGVLRDECRMLFHAWKQQPGHRSY